MHCETIPIKENQFSLDFVQKRGVGIPLLKMDIAHTDNDWKMHDDFMIQAQEMLEIDECKEIKA